MAAQLVLKPNDPNARLIEALCTSLRRRQIIGSLNVALATAALIQNIVRSVKYTTIDELLGLIKSVGRRLHEANPKELASGNIVRRILRLIREEYRAAAAAHHSAPSSEPETPFLGPTDPGLHAPSSHYLSHSTDLSFSSPKQTPRPAPTHQASSYLSYGSTAFDRQTSLSNFVAMRHTQRTASILDASMGMGMTSMSASTSSLFASPTRGSSMDDLRTPGAALSRTNSGDFMRQSGKLKPVLIQAIEEVVGELETTHEDVAKGAKEHVHSSEIILTLGHSKTVEAFLKQAFRDRKFTVVVAESAPSYLGQSLASSFSSSGIPTLLIPDSSIHAIMPRITKLILGAHTVLANGGLFALSGSLAAALAARAYAKPVVVTTGQFKFAPAWNLYHEYGAVDFQGPGAVVGYDGNGSGGGPEGAESIDPYYDYVRPELINLFLTNEGDHSPAYIYRLIKEAYDDEDVELL